MSFSLKEDIGPHLLFESLELKSIEEELHSEAITLNSEYR